MRMGGNIVGPHGARVHDQPAVVSGHRPQSELRPREDRVSGRSERSQAETHRVGGKLIRLRSDADRIKNLAFAIIVGAQNVEHMIPTPGDFD